MINQVPHSFKNYIGPQPQNPVTGAANTPPADPNDMVSITNGSGSGSMKSLSSLAAAKALLSDGEKPGVTKLWEVKAGDSYNQILHATVNKDGVFFNNIRETCKIDLDGNVAWRVKNGTSSLDEVSFDKNGNVYTFGTESLISVDPSGKVNWEETNSGIGHYKPVITSSCVYATSYDRTVSCYEFDGKKRWEVDLDDSLEEPPIPDDNGRLHLISKPLYGGGLTHTIIDEKKTLFFKKVKPQKTILNEWCNEMNLVIGKDGSQYGLDHGKYRAKGPAGDEKWSFDIPEAQENLKQKMGPDGNLYLLVDGKSTIIKLTPDGKEEWRVTKNKRSEQMSADFVWGTDGTLYVTGESGNPNIYAINPNGTKKWTHNDQVQNFYSLRLGQDGTVYASSGPNKVDVISPNDGSTITRVFSDAGSHFFWYRPCPGGDIVTGTNDGRIARYHCPSRQEIIEYEAAKIKEAAENMKDKEEMKNSENVPDSGIVVGDNVVKIGKMELKKRGEKI